MPEKLVIALQINEKTYSHEHLFKKARSLLYLGHYSTSMYVHTQAREREREEGRVGQRYILLTTQVKLSGKREFKRIKKGCRVAEY